MISNAEIESYIKQINALLPLHSKKEKRYLNELQESITEMAIKSTDMTMSDIIEYHGTPANVVRDYVSSLDTDRLTKNIKLRGFIKKTIAAILIALAIAFSICSIYIHKAIMDSKNTVVKDEGTIYK